MSLSEKELLNDLKKSGFRPKKTQFGGKPAWEFARGISELLVGEKLKRHGWKQQKLDVSHGGMSGTLHLEKDGTTIQIYAAPLAKTRLFFANHEESSMSNKTSAAFPLVEMAAEPIKLEKRSYDWNEFKKAVQNKMFYDPKTFDRMKFSELPKNVQERIHGKWNARYPSDEAMPKSASIRNYILERAAENAFQNRDVHLANALYNHIGAEHSPVDDPQDVPVEGQDLDVPGPEETNSFASELEDQHPVPVEGSDLDVPEPDSDNPFAE